MFKRAGKPKDLLFAIYRRTYANLWWRFPRLFHTPRAPQIVELELTNDCNQACPHCPRDFMNREIGYFDLHLFRRIIDEICSYPWCHLRIVGLGEPAMHPHLEEMLDYLTGKPLKTEFTTNGTLFMRFSPEEILKWHIDILGISIDGHDATSYSRHRPNSDYTALREKVTEFFNAREELATNFPQIRIRNVVFPRTTAEHIHTFTKKWLPFADKVMFNALIPKAESKPAVIIERCEDILFTMHVRWDGRVPLCGYQLWCGEVEWLGDAHDCSLRKLWHSDRLREMRRCHASGDFGRIAFCRQCFYTQRKKKILNITRKYDKSKNPVLDKIHHFAIGF